MGDYFKVHMISPPLFVYDAAGEAYTAVGWSETKANGRLEPIINNPDGPGVGTWSTYHGDDPWAIG